MKHVMAAVEKTNKEINDRLNAITEQMKETWNAYMSSCAQGVWQEYAKLMNLQNDLLKQLTINTALYCMGVAISQEDTVMIKDCMYRINRELT